MIKVAILTTVRNEEANIGNCIFNVIQQEGISTVHYIVDDGSTDNTIEVVTNYVERYADDPNHSIILLCNTNPGRANALNFGITHIKERYIAILDADDSWHVNKSAIQLELMQKFDLSVVGTGVEFREPFETTRDLGYGHGNLPLHHLKIVNDNILRYNPLAHSSVIIDAYLLKESLIYPDRKSQVDYGLWLSLYFKGFRIGHFPDKLCFRKIGRGQSFESRNHLKYAYNSVKLQWKYIFLHKKFLYCFYSMPRIIWAVMPQSFRISLRKKWR